MFNFIFLFCILTLNAAPPSITIEFNNGKQIRLSKTGMNGEYKYGNQRIHPLIMTASTPTTYSCEFVIDNAMRSIPVGNLNYIRIIKVDKEVTLTKYRIIPMYVVSVFLKNGTNFQAHMAIANIFGNLSDGSTWRLTLENNREIWFKLKRIIFH